MKNPIHDGRMRSGVRSVRFFEAGSLFEVCEIQPLSHKNEHLDELEDVVAEAVWHGDNLDSAHSFSHDVSVKILKLSKIVDPNLRSIEIRSGYSCSTILDGLVRLQYLTIRSIEWCVSDLDKENQKIVSFVGKGKVGSSQ